VRVPKRIFYRIAFLIAVLPLIAILAFVFISQGEKAGYEVDTKFENGYQIIEFTAKNGFFPSSIKAKAGVESKIRVKTFNTYDCTRLLNIPKVGINNVELDPNGIYEFIISPQKPGEVLKGSCSTGANVVEIKFV